MTRASLDRRMVDSAAALPALPRPEHVFASKDWLRAWERATIERTLGSRYLCHDELGEPIAFHHVEHSPFWSAYEREGGVERVWPGTVVFAPSVYSIYGAAPAGPAAIDAVVDAGLEEVADRDADAALFVNVQERAARRWMAHRPPSAALVLDLAHSSPAGASVDDQLAGLRSHVRRELRRQWRRACGHGLELLALAGPQMRPHLEAFQRLASATSQRHSGDLYDLATFEALSEAPGAVLLAAQRGGELLGAFLCFGYGDRFYLWTAGIDDASMREHGTYAFLFVESIAHAIREGRRVIEAGRGNSAYKARHGFAATKLWTLVYLGERSLGDRALERRLSAMRSGLARHLGLA